MTGLDWFLWAVVLFAFWLLWWGIWGRIEPDPPQLVVNLSKMAGGQASPISTAEINTVEQAGKNAEMRRMLSPSYDLGDWLESRYPTPHPVLLLRNRRRVRVPLRLIRR